MIGIKIARLLNGFLIIFRVQDVYFDKVESCFLVFILGLISNEHLSNPGLCVPTLLHQIAKVHCPRLQKSSGRKEQTPAGYSRI